MLWPSLLLLALIGANQAHPCVDRDDCRRQDDSKPCGRAEKTKFSENLFDLFRAEYGKSLARDTDNQRILKWKFESLDRNDDGFLQLSEYKPLKRLKRLVKPKRCAKAFTRSCDRDHDSLISKEEWSDCLGVEVSSKRNTPIVALYEHKRKKEEPEANDCQSDRLTVLAEQRANELYVPECADDGRYQRVQCYKSTGYCWCVHEDDGKPIPGTSVKDDTPDCDSNPTPIRPIKGCPFEKKEQFLADLNNFMMRNDSNGTLAAVTFANFDSDGNKFLERKEWKTFRAFVASHKALRRCGKRLPRFCDINNDLRISITEWMHCLEGQPSYQKRRGPNPLKSILKDD